MKKQLAEVDAEVAVLQRTLDVLHSDEANVMHQVQNLEKEQGILVSNDLPFSVVQMTCRLMFKDSL